MTYLKNHDHDVFISYAHRDDVDRWVTDFRRFFKNALEGNIEVREGKKGVKASIWKDTGSLRQQGVLDDRLKETIQQSAFFLVILSDQWSLSEVCRNELQFFRDVAGKDFFDRIFIALHGELRREWPEGLKDGDGHPLLHYAFVRETDGDTATISIKTDQGGLNPAAKEVLDKASKDLANSLYELRHGSAAEESSLPSVFVAICPEGAAERHRGLLTANLDGTYTVLPTTPPTNRQEFQEFEETLVMDVRVADLFVQVLDSNNGRYLTDARDGLVRLQAAKAAELNKRTLQWFEPGLRIEDVPDPKYAEYLRSLKQIARGGTLVDGDLAALESAINAQLDAIAVSAPPKKQRTCWIAYQIAGTDKTQVEKLAGMMEQTPSRLKFRRVPVPDYVRPSEVADVQKTCQGAVILWGQLGLDEVKDTIDDWDDSETMVSVAYCDPPKRVEIEDFVRIRCYSDTDLAETMRGVEAYVRELEEQILGT